MESGGGDAPAALRCAECGERIVRGRAPGTFTHTARLVAACDLDSDHPAVPDPTALGEVPCRVCGAPVVARGDGFAHAEPAGDDDHRADPRLPP